MSSEMTISPLNNQQVVHDGPLGSSGGASSSSSSKQRDEVMVGAGSGGAEIPHSPDHAPEQAGDEEGSEEARVPRTATTPKDPTPEEYRAHRITHLPYRAWCPHCVRAKKRNNPHTRRHRARDNKRLIP
eukprot:4498003-Karenia_brevis.AAC.1